MIPADLFYSSPGFASLLFVLPPLVLLLLFLALWRRRIWQRYGAPGLLSMLLSPLSNKSFWLRAFFLCGAWIFAVVALMGPEGANPFSLETRFSVSPAATTREDLERKAREGNLEVRILVQQANRSRRRVSEEASAYYPTVDLGYSWRHASPNDHDRIDTSWWKATVRLDYPLFDGGRARAKKRAARERSLAADLRVTEAVRRAEALARVEWARERELEVARGSARSLVELASRNVRATQDRVDGAKVKASSVARARAERMAAQLEVFRLQAEVIRSRCRQHALAGELVLDKF